MPGDIILLDMHVYHKWRSYDHMFLKYKHSFFQGWDPAFSEETPSFWSRFKKLPPSFFGPPKLVHVKCMKPFKMMVLCLVLYKVNWEYHYHYSLYFQAQLCIYCWHLLWLNIDFNVFHIWYVRRINMKNDRVTPRL